MVVGGILVVLLSLNPSHGTVELEVGEGGLVGVHVGSQPQLGALAVVT